MFPRFCANTSPNGQPNRQKISATPTTLNSEGGGQAIRGRRLSSGSRTKSCRFGRVFVRILFERRLCREASLKEDSKRAVAKTPLIVASCFATGSNLLH